LLLMLLLWLWTLALWTRPTARAELPVLIMLMVPLLPLLERFLAV
jgi:hypothetical protein